MTRIPASVLLILMASMWFAACSSELRDASDLPTEPRLNGVHPSGYIVFTSADFHGKKLAGMNYDMSTCKTCHAPDYSGGLSGQSCNSSGCHVSADGGPEACYTCHGDPVTKAAYPTYQAAHVTHVLGGNGSAVTLECSACHDMPSGFADPKHLGGADPNGAEVILSSALAETQTKGRSGASLFNSTDRSCANTYCHGNFTNGNNVTVSWNGTNQAACGSCHGNPATGNPLPKAPHPQVETCSTCHPGVVDANKNIIGKELHINGVLNVFNQTRTDW